MAVRILLTGLPGCGKTTAIRRTIALIHRPALGFFTEEVRGVGTGRAGRIGFDVVTLDGARGALARAGASGPRVGRYAVDVATFERVGVSALEHGLDDRETLIVIDELGKMEFCSRRFVTLLERLFAAPNPILGAIMARPHPVADRLRNAAGVTVVEVTAANRDELPAQLAARLKAYR